MDFDVKRRALWEGVFFFYRGNWHGQVAVKVIEIKEPTAIQLQAFKMQVCRSLDTMKEALVRKYN